MPKARKPDQTLSVLVRKAQQGDRDAESALLSALTPVIRSFFLKRIGAHAELDDLVQNTLLRVFRGVQDIKDGSRIRAFALKAALFELQDLYRGRYGSRETTVASELMEPSVRPERDGLGIDIERALAKLTPKARRIIELKALGYKYEEIAETVGTTEAAVKMQVKRALERLRTVLATVVLLLLFADWVRLML